jgi:hypothetical protein
LKRIYILSKKAQLYQGALAEWLTRCPAISLDEDNERHFLRERVFESHRRRSFGVFGPIARLEIFFLKRQEYRTEDGASFELFCKIFEHVVVVLWSFEVEVWNKGFAWW